MKRWALGSLHRLLALSIPAVLSLLSLLWFPAFANPPSVRAKDLDLDDLLTMAWEGQWQQSGFPMVVRRWNQPVAAKVLGPFASDYREIVRAQLAEMSQATGVPARIVESPDDLANLEILIVREPVEAIERGPCNTRLIANPSGIQRVQVTARVDVVKRCLLHELGHAFGLEGHPSGRSVMTYFSRPDGLSDYDRWLLRLRYSPRLVHGMSPIKFVIEAARLYESELVDEQEKREARREAQQFVAKLFSDMGSYAIGQGEPPKVLFRSGKTIPASVEQGRVSMSMHLALAYLNGDGVARDVFKGLEWSQRAALQGNVQAQLLSASIYEGRYEVRNEGAAPGNGHAQKNLALAHQWYRCAQGKGGGQAGPGLARVEMAIVPEGRQSIREASDAFAKTAACRLNGATTPPTTTP